MTGTHPRGFSLICGYAGFTGVWHNLLSLCSHRFSLRWLCAHALCLHSKQSAMSSVNGPISFELNLMFSHIPVKISGLLSFWPLTAVHLPRSGLTGLRTGEDGLHTEQQAQGDPPGDAVGCCTGRPPAGWWCLCGLPWGQPMDSNNNIVKILQTKTTRYS